MSGTRARGQRPMHGNAAHKKDRGGEQRTIWHVAPLIVDH